MQSHGILGGETIIMDQQERHQQQGLKRGRRSTTSSSRSRSSTSRGIVWSSLSLVCASSPALYDKGLFVVKLR